MPRNWKRILGGPMAAIGWWFSPLTPFNELWSNIPAALILATPFGFISKTAFMIMVPVAYLFSNVLGLALLHRGLIWTGKKKPEPYGKKQLARDSIISGIYLLIILGAIWAGYLKPLYEYFPK